MKGYQIFLHSVKQVFGNIGSAIRVSGVLFLVQSITTLFLGRHAMMAEGQNPAALPQGGLFLMLVLILVMVITSLWIAVAWHRYVLRVEEPSSILPAFHGGRLLAYLGYSFLIGIVLLVPIFVLGALAGFVAQAGLGAAILGAFIVLVPLILITFRLSSALPAAALGEPLGLRGAWDATRGATPDFLVLAVIAAVASFAIDLPLRLLAGSLPLAIAWSLISLWIKTMVGASILTTIYGHYVEHRPLAA